MKYTQLNPDYKYISLAGAIHAREMEYFHYDFDRINFEHIIGNTQDEAFREDVMKRLRETEVQMKRCLNILDALWSQVDDEEAYARAVEQIKQEREQKDASK